MRAHIQVIAVHKTFTQETAEDLRQLAVETLGTPLNEQDFYLAYFNTENVLRKQKIQVLRQFFTLFLEQSRIRLQTKRFGKLDAMPWNQPPLQRQHNPFFPVSRPLETVINNTQHKAAANLTFKKRS